MRPVSNEVVLAVHGGAGTPAGDIDGQLERRYRDGIAAALAAGRDALDGGGALDAVEAAVAALEDDEVFNAGRGSVYTSDATLELEAAIMDGSSRRAGGAALLTHVRNPVRLARMVLERSPHVLLAGAAAERFAQRHGVELVASRHFHTERRLRRLLEGGDDFAADRDGGTVGAVARDGRGRVAAATSTGGRTGKSPGRVGDTPLVGAGTYADGEVAVSTTGKGEFFVLAVAAHAVAARVAHAGAGVAAAAERVLDDVVALGGSGGLIALDRDGRLAAPFDTPVMHRGAITRAGEIRVALFADEDV